MSEDWIRLPFGQERFDSGMSIARAARAARARAASAAAVGLAHELAAGELPQMPAPDDMWTVRGEQRTRATFGRPHRDDFRGGLPLPAQYPGRSQ